MTFRATVSIKQARLQHSFCHFLTVLCLCFFLGPVPRSNRIPIFTLYGSNNVFSDN